MTDEEVTQEAMLLTPSEWEALAGICDYYLYRTEWADDAEQVPEIVRKRRELAERILDD